MNTPCHILADVCGKPGLCGRLFFLMIVWNLPFQKCENAPQNSVIPLDSFSISFWENKVCCEMLKREGGGGGSVSESGQIQTCRGNY